MDVGSITLHPSGVPHGPQPVWRRSQSGCTRPRSLRSWSDTFHPLKLTKFAKELDGGKYAYLWYENAPDVAGAEAAVHGDATRGGLTSHF